MNKTHILIAIAMASIVLFGSVWFYLDYTTDKYAPFNVPATILVKNGMYLPGLIQAPAGKIIRLHFLRIDNGMCASAVFFPKLNVAFQLPLYQLTEIDLPPQPPGDIEFTCQMHSYHGKLILV